MLFGAGKARRRKTLVDDATAPASLPGHGVSKLLVLGTQGPQAVGKAVGEHCLRLLQARQRKSLTAWRPQMKRKRAKPLWLFVVPRRRTPRIPCSSASMTVSFYSGRVKNVTITYAETASHTATCLRQQILPCHCHFPDTITSLIYCLLVSRIVTSH